jgi:hypothetical protein
MTMGKKAPPNIPERGDLASLRGNPARFGVVSKYDPETNWATVEWDDGGGPRLCHRFELERRDRNELPHP